MSKMKLSESARAEFRKIGKAFGHLGGKARAANMTPEERSASGKKAVAARDLKKKGLA